MNNREIILNEFEKLKGQFVITMSDTVERLVAITEDDIDYYYVTYNGRRLAFHTCVGKVIELKGKLDDDDYDEFERLAELNHQDRLIEKTGYILIQGEQYGIDDYKIHLTRNWGTDDKLLTDIIFRSDV